jgi:hypothetical protein
MGIMGSALQWVMMGGFWDLPSPVFDNVWVQSLPRTHTHTGQERKSATACVLGAPEVGCRCLGFTFGL